MDRGTRLGENACGDDGVESGWVLLVEAGVGGGRRGGDGDSPVPNRPAQAELDLSHGSGNGRGGVVDPGLDSVAAEAVGLDCAGAEVGPVADDLM